VPTRGKTRVTKALSWTRFIRRRTALISPRDKPFAALSLAEKLALWPQHSAITAYFQQVPRGMAASISAFTCLIYRFLTVHDLRAWELALGMPGGSRYMDTVMYPPLCPLRRRSHGCGCAVSTASTQHSQPSVCSLVHWAWPFLSIRDRQALAQIQPDSLSNGGPNIFQTYAKLRMQAGWRSVGYLRQPRHPSPSVPGAIPHIREADNGVALLRYDFVYADFIRSMANIYTYQNRNIDAIWDIIDSVAHIPPAPGWPSIDFNRTFKAMTLGVPLAGDFSCHYSSVAKRNQYNNHATVKTPAVQDAISQKFIKEEDLSYNIVFQRWLWRFIPGIFLNPLTFVMPKYLGGMGRICVDSTNVIDSTDDGAPNQQIPKPGLPDSLDENPSIAYGTALI